MVLYTCTYSRLIIRVHVSTCLVRFDTFWLQGLMSAIHTHTRQTQLEIHTGNSSNGFYICQMVRFRTNLPYLGATSNNLMKCWRCNKLDSIFIELNTRVARKRFEAWGANLPLRWDPWICGSVSFQNRALKISPIFLKSFVSQSQITLLTPLLAWSGLHLRPEFRLSGLRSSVNSQNQALKLLPIVLKLIFSLDQNALSTQILAWTHFAL